MRWFRLLPAVALASQLAARGADSPKADSGERGRMGASNASVILPAVLRTSEPADNVVFTLPGPPPAVAAPVRPPATVVPPVPDLDRSTLRHPPRAYPPDFAKDSADFLHQHIALWTKEEARQLLGDPQRQRPALDDSQKVNGQILAFSDPTGRYKELELDFDQDTGQLRAVFVYPLQMTWQDCRRTFGTKVRAAQVNKGRTFYSYLNRRLDVLVDPTGKVISLGLY
jgi:hypothetical protein